MNRRANLIIAISLLIVFGALIFEGVQALGIWP